MKIPRLLQAVLVPLAAFVFLRFVVQPPIPASVLRLYMFFIIVGDLLYFTFDDKSAQELVRPIREFLLRPRSQRVRMIVLILVPLWGGYMTYNGLKPSPEAPPGLRTVHPAPPSSVNIFDRNFDLLKLTNPLREDEENFAQHVNEGGQIYFKNCFFCHGDQLNGRGHFAHGFNLRPANFQDVGTIAQLQESYVFWRITTGGPGLPDNATPWDSAMPRWQDMLTEEEVWKVVLFLYEKTGHVPRQWEEKEGY